MDIKKVIGSLMEDPKFLKASIDTLNDQYDKYREKYHSNKADTYGALAEKIADEATMDLIESIIESYEEKLSELDPHKFVYNDKGDYLAVVKDTEVNAYNVGAFIAGQTEPYYVYPMFVPKYKMADDICTAMVDIYTIGRGDQQEVDED